MSLSEAYLGAKLQRSIAQKVRAEIATATAPTVAPNDMAEPAAQSALYLMKTKSS